MNSSSEPAPLVSVIILNYNGARWLERCLESLKGQSLFSKIEIIVADNQSSDGSDVLAEELLLEWTNGRFVQHGANLGYCEGNNRAAEFATGEYLLFLNNDTWLESDCLELLVNGVRSAGAAAGMPLVLNYADDTFQSLGAAGFDFLGLTSKNSPFDKTHPVFMPEGCAYLIERRLFESLGGFDPVFFMFSDELDLSWRLWISGHSAVAVSSARLHHRSAANVNPKGDAEITELRTSDTKRYYANRNGLLVLLKNGQHILLLLVPVQVVFLLVEGLVGFLIVRRWSFFRKTVLNAIGSCWHHRHHIVSERGRIRKLRKRSDSWMVRFFRIRPNRWDEVLRIIRFGPPKVSDH